MKSITQNDRINEMVLDGLLVDLHRRDLEVADLKADRDWYRLATKMAIHAMHKLTTDRDRLREQVRDLRRQFREAA